MTGPLPEADETALARLSAADVTALTELVGRALWDGESERLPMWSAHKVVRLIAPWMAERDARIRDEAADAARRCGCHHDDAEDERFCERCIRFGAQGAMDAARMEIRAALAAATGLRGDEGGPGVPDEPENRSEGPSSASEGQS